MFSISNIPVIFILACVITQNDAGRELDTVDAIFCKDLYPFSYAKCARICSPTLDSTCLDDDLCDCDMKFVKPSTAGSKSSVQGLVSSRVANDVLCKPQRFQTFCKESCQTALSQSGQLFNNGVLCSKTTTDFGLIKMCVCTV